MLRRGFVGAWQSPASVGCATLDPNLKGVHPTIEALAASLTHGPAPHVAALHLIIPLDDERDRPSDPKTQQPRLPFVLSLILDTCEQSARKPCSHTLTCVDTAPDFETPSLYPGLLGQSRSGPPHPKLWCRPSACPN